MDTGFTPSRTPTTAFLLSLQVLTLARAYDVLEGTVEYPFSGDAIALLTGRDPYRIGE